MSTEPPRTRRIWIGVAAVFLGGVATGVVGLGAWIHHRVDDLHARGPVAMHELLIDMLARRLDLTDEQAEKLDEIIYDVHMQMLHYWQKNGAEIRVIIEDGMTRMEAELDAEQLPSWQELRERVEGHLEAGMAPIGEAHGR